MAVTHVARHKLAGIQDLGTALAPHCRVRTGQALERVERALRPPLLGQPDDGVEHDNDRDGHGVRHIADESRQQRRRDQYQHHEIPELVEHALNQTPGRRLR